MEITLLVLLLLCTLSTARPKSEDDGQDVPSDINAVLRELTADVAVLKEQLKQQHEDNKAQKPSSDLTVLIDMNSKVYALQARVEQLEKLNQEQATKLKQIDTLTSQVNTMKEEKQVGQVAFSASYAESDVIRIGPTPVKTPMIFRHVFSNIGNAYNPDTGYFTAPVRGVYHFEFHLYGDSGKLASARLVKGSTHIVIAHQLQTTGAGTSSNGATLVLEPGNVVSVHQTVESIIADSASHHTTFSGHLLFTI